MGPWAKWYRHRAGETPQFVSHFEGGGFLRYDLMIIEPHIGLN